MIDLATAPYAVLLLRLAAGALFLAHMALKLFVFKPSGTKQYFSSLGLPGWVGLLTIGVEFVGGTFLILGIAPRYVAMALLPTVIGTIVLVHGKNGWLFTNNGGGWEYPALWATVLLAIALLGDGAGVLIPSRAVF